MTVGAFVGLAQFRKLNYQYKRNDAVVYKEQLKHMGLDEDDYQMQTTESLKKEYEKVMEKLDIEHWDNIRGPRPWENSREIQEKMRKNNPKVSA
ncbi:unnamed protein product [Brachionus calyciflorus]|uniref:Cytochrome c oxidase assembly protein COX16 homolog, mitochondrial n=1 Tax=Brachionus calyciflorus TaxID=104777 RepID=A0A814E5P2_9BILA|nr:unnamed protein product [Brachionus calyciflorus]